MYIPKYFEQPSVEAMHALIAANPFATLVTLGSEGLSANHIPMELQKKPGPYGTLTGHVARANPVWREVSSKPEALVIFQGPNAYITPSWYPSKKETGKAVPTWNYIVVHAHGTVRVIDDPAWLRDHIEKLTRHHESSFPHPWAVSDAPDNYIEQMIGGIIGIEIRIAKLVGKWKLSQNRPEADRTGVIDGLQNLNTPDALHMAELIKRNNK